MTLILVSEATAQTKKMQIKFYKISNSQTKITMGCTGEAIDQDKLAPDLLPPSTPHF